MGELVSLEERRAKKAAKLQVPTASDQKVLDKSYEKSPVEAYSEYVLSSEGWANDGFWESIYEGYPFVPPCEPHRPDMEWYVSPEMQHFGVWVLNQSTNTTMGKTGQYGWIPFVRKSEVPISEPLNVINVDQRKCISWIVDENGFGQYGMVMPDGYIWMPHKKPAGWTDSGGAG